MSGLNWTEAELLTHEINAAQSGDNAGNRLRPNISGVRSRSKFGVDMSSEGKARRTVDGILFASEREAFHYQALTIAAQAGAIKDLKLQQKFELLAAFADSSGNKVKAVTYTPDFTYTQNGQLYAIDVKSKATRTQQYVLRSKWFRYLYPSYIFLEWK